MKRLFRRPPDFIIGGPERPYLRRWWVIPRNRWFNIYLHQILRDDEDRALHDHPWVNCSIPLTAGYIEVRPAVRPDITDQVTAVVRRVGRPVFRRAVAAHRIVLLRDSAGQPIPCWSLFLTGPVVRTWGFWCSWGWRPWREFVDSIDTGRAGKGCGD